MEFVDLRPAALADAAAVADVHRQARASYYGEPPGPDDREQMWTALLLESGRLTQVAEVAGRLVGFVSFRPEQPRRRAWELSGLYVAPPVHGRGVGSCLYDVFDARRGPDPGVLEVWAGNQRAIDFYVRRGWRATDQVRPGPQDLDFVTYRIGP